MNAQFAPLSAQNYLAVTGHPPARTVRGFAVETEERPLLVVGMYADEERHVLFSQATEELVAKLDTFGGRRAVLMAAQKAMEMVRDAWGPVECGADPTRPKSGALLERMGFRLVGGNTYRYGGMTVRQQVQQAEAIMRARGTPVEIPVVHHFANPGTEHGCYAREIRIPAGTLLTGKVHKTEQINVLSAGEISVLTEEGIKRIKAPFTIVSPAGTKRIAYTHTDCVWTTFHATRETDLEKIEAIFIEKEEAALLEMKEAA